MSIINFIGRTAKLVKGENLFFRLGHSCPVLLLGNKNASFAVNPEIISEGDIVYSFGVGTDISFDLELIRRFNCKVLAFDPTPKSIEWLGTQNLPEKFSSCPVGLAHYSGEADFFLPESNDYVSASLTRRQSEKIIRVRVKTLDEIMAEFGHSKLGILKMDIEGAEYDVIDHIIRKDLKIRQIVVEFHHRYHPGGSSKTRETIKKLDEKGYKLFYVSDTSEEFSFIYTGNAG